MKEEEYRVPDTKAFANEEAEMSVLGAMLQDKKAVDRAKEALDVTDFTFPEYRVLYSALLEMDNKGIPIDLVTSSTELGQQNKLDMIGGISALMRLMANVPTTANVGYYIRIVKDCSSRRKLKEIGTEMIRKAGYLEEEIDSIREKAALAVRDVKGSSGIKIVNQQDAIMSTYEAIERNQKREGQENNRIRTGIGPLDKMTGGLTGSKLMIIGARPSVGKSIFAMTICANAAKQGKKVLYVSCEMEVEELMEREMAGVSMVPLSEITSDEVTEDGWMKLAQSLPELAQRQIYYCTEIYLVEEVRKAAFHLYENGGLDLICVDYIQLLKSAQKRNSRQEEVADISRSLKWLAQELKIPVIALTQLNRASAREKRPPTMAEARESGAIEQDANIFLLLHDPDVDELKTEDLRRMHKAWKERGLKLIYVNVDKNRQGKKGIFYIGFDGDHMRFLPLRKDDPNEQ